MDIPNWNRVYSKIVESDNNEYKYDSEFPYLEIPLEYADICIKLMNLLNSFGKDMLSDCNAACSNKGKIIINCWTLFQIALKAYNVGKAQECYDLIDYIKYQLKIINNDNKEQVAELFVDENLTIKGACQSNNQTKVFIDKEFNSAYEDYLLHKDDGKVFVKINY